MFGFGFRKRVWFHGFTVKFPKLGFTVKLPKLVWFVSKISKTCLV